MNANKAKWAGKHLWYLGAWMESTERMSRYERYQLGGLVACLYKSGSQLYPGDLGSAFSCENRVGPSLWIRKGPKGNLNGTFSDDCKLTPEDPPHDYDLVKNVTIKEGNTEIMTESEDDKKIGRCAFIDKLILSSSAIYNANKYMDCTVTSPTTLCLNGLRVINNNWDFADQSVKFTSRVVTESGLGVDTFFFLSGFLVSFLTLKQLAKGNGKINWALFYFHRFWRITPTYMVSLAVWMNLLLKWGHGPSHDIVGKDTHDVCQKQWWYYLLYINNLYPYPGSTTENVLADDMQFFIISPFILYLLYRFWKAGMLAIVVLFLTSFGSTIYLCMYWGLGFANTGYYNDRAAKDTRPGDDYIYTKPWHRIPPYLIGILFGYMLCKLKGRNIEIGWWKNILGWFIAASTALTIIYVGQATSPDTPQWAAVLYNTFGRTMFSMSVVWVAFSCIMGYGGLVNRFLSWSIWIPLGRLTFGAYLFHPTMIGWMLYTRKTLMHFSYVDFSYFFVSNVVFSYACAFIFVLLVEGPTGSLEDALLGNRRRGNTDKKK
ncbi:nose resistant to fluoxetine protein 6-like [Amphiura filiformis]|uniref:nose resistant to fluoxetine protein 6-like n=1 Tax=Amphiura filiformis TaxID=82378 RepID=UPI003B214BED